LNNWFLRLSVDLVFFFVYSKNVILEYKNIQIKHGTVDILIFIKIYHHLENLRFTEIVEWVRDQIFVYAYLQIIADLRIVVAIITVREVVVVFELFEDVSVLIVFFERFVLLFFIFEMILNNHTHSVFPVWAKIFLQTMFWRRHDLLLG
jgi:hypothetical protein